MQLKMNGYTRDLEYPKDKRNPNNKKWWYFYGKRSSYVKEYLNNNISSKYLWFEGKNRWVDKFCLPKFSSQLWFFWTPPQKPELDQINVDGYRLDAAYCRQVVKRGGVCIFVKKTWSIQVLIWVSVTKIKTLKFVC